MVAQLDKEYLLQRPARALSRLVSYGLFEGRPLTTRGRWINSWLIKYFHRIACTESASHPTNKIDRPLFILGTGRSGTTVLGKILSLHREVGWLNEPKLFWHIACPYEDLNGNYTNQPARYRLFEEDAGEATRIAIRNLYAHYLRSTRNSRVLDKYPELIFRVPFIKQIFPDARFLLLVRNGYDTCRSISQWSSAHGGHKGNTKTDWWGVNNRKWHCLVNELVRNNGIFATHADAIADYQDHAWMAAIEWTLTMREILRVANDFPDSTHIVRYEDLTATPRDTITQILEFCELPQDPTVVDYAASTLQPSRKTGQLELPEAIADEFAETMEKLGYNAAPESSY